MKRLLSNLSHTMASPLTITVAFCCIYAQLLHLRNNSISHSICSTAPPSLSPCSPRDPQVIVYNRIPKAGSSTILNLLKNLSSVNNFALISPTPYYNHSVARDAILAALSSGKRAVVCNHFNFPELLYGKNDIAYINVMRDPVDRCISTYYYSRYGDRSNSEKREVLGRYGDITLDECLAKPDEELSSCLNCPPALQALAFCGRDGGSCSESSETLLQQSWETIKSHYFVGLTEDLDGTAAMLEGLFPSFFKGMTALSAVIAPKNTLQGRDEYVLPSGQGRDIIAKKSVVDVELYRKVEERYNQLKTLCAW